MRMGPSPSWTPLLNQRLMGNCLSLCTGNLNDTVQYLQWDSHHHLSAKFSVIHTLSHRAQTVCSNPKLLHKEKTHLRNALTQYKYPKWALDKVHRRLNKPSSETSDEANNKAPQVPSLLPKKPKVTLLYPTHKVSVNVSKSSVVDMAYRPTSKVVIPSGTTSLPQGKRPYGQPKWDHLLVPMW